MRRGGGEEISRVVQWCSEVKRPRVVKPLPSAGRGDVKKNIIIKEKKYREKSTYQITK
jgi:hypothetical protein